MDSFRPRIIPCLLLKNGGLVKSKKFRDHIYLGDPINCVKIFNDSRADELIFLDIEATKNGAGPNFGLLEQITREAYMPFSYGGGISNVETAERLISLGVEKVIINSASRENRDLAKKIAARYGSQALVCAMDVVMTSRGYRVYDHVQAKTLSVTPLKLLKIFEENGAGEIFIQSVDRDGCRTGYDLVLLNRICRNTRLPVIACGGVDSDEDLVLANRLTGASGLSAGSRFVFSGGQDSVLIHYPDEYNLEKIATAQPSCKRLNILVLCNPGDTHNVNWFRYMSSYANLFVVGNAHDTAKISDPDLKLFEELRIKLLKPLPDYSLSKPRRSTTGAKQLAAFIREYSIDAAQIQYATDYSLWNKSLTVPYIITTRGSDVFLDIPRIISKRTTGKIWKRKYYQAFLNASYITSTSERQREQIESIFNIDDGIVVRTGVNISEIDATLNSDRFPIPEELLGKKYIFCPRYLLPLYQNEKIVSAFAKIREEIPSNYQLVFIGARNSAETKYESDFRKLCSSYQIQYHVYRQVPEGLMWRLFQHASVAVMVPKSDGTPVSGMEALAIRCPLILGNVSYDQQIFRGAAMVMNSDDEGELTSLLEQALTNYPPQFLSKGYLSVRKHGNRSVEMNLLRMLFQSMYFQQK